MKSRDIRLTIESDLENVPLIGMAVNTICSSLRFDRDIAYQIELCVVEAVNNCIVHAYENKAGSTVEVFIELLPKQIIFNIYDTGKQIKDFPALFSSAPSFDPNDVATLPESGIGFYIMRKVMDEVKYERIGNRNMLSLIKKFNETIKQKDDPAKIHVV